MALTTGHTRLSITTISMASADSTKEATCRVVGSVGYAVPRFLFRTVPAGKQFVVWIRTLEHQVPVLALVPDTLVPDR